MTAIQCNFQKKTVYQCYINTEERVRLHTTHGFGDFLRGCCTLYQMSLENNWDLKVDFSSHPLSQFFHCSVPARNLALSDVCHAFTKERILKHVLSSTDMQTNLFTNLIPEKRELSVECRNFIIEECLNPLPDFQATLNKRFADMELERRKYVVFHVRAGDAAFDGAYSAYFYQLVSIAAQRIKQETQLPVVIISDCVQLRDQIAKEFNFIATTGKTVHFGHPNLDRDAVQDTLIEFFLLAFAAHVSSISAYRWPSGFAKQVCQIYGTEFENIDAHHRMDFSYGAEDKWLECSLQATRQFFSRQQILIKRKENFNDLFGDVAPNREKALKITFDDKVLMTFSEGRNRGYRITQTDT